MAKVTANHLSQVPVTNMWLGRTATNLSQLLQNSPRFDHTVCTGFWAESMQLGSMHQLCLEVALRRLEEGLP
jgi:hypothetical protein